MVIGYGMKSRPEELCCRLSTRPRTKATAKEVLPWGNGWRAKKWRSAALVQIVARSNAKLSRLAVMRVTGEQTERTSPGNWRQRVCFETRKEGNEFRVAMAQCLSCLAVRASANKPQACCHDMKSGQLTSFSCSERGRDRVIPSWASAIRLRYLVVP